MAEYVGAVKQNAVVRDIGRIEHAHPDFFSKDGVSAVLASTPKGKNLFESVKKAVQAPLLITFYISIDEALLQHCRPLPPKRALYA
jgi:hypothetical protein